jgi:hypothetical protein
VLKERKTPKGGTTDNEKETKQTKRPGEREKEKERERERDG